jgi:hypothetical protein
LFKIISAVDLDLWRNDVAHISGVNLYDKRVLPASSASFTPLSDNSTSTHPVNLFSKFQML